ncbi:MAG: hypothetical protein MZV64_12585 [Ignavibacteriales bacterium]|nr:hypothetical protein [Ignavibacteriales bacterium]
MGQSDLAYDARIPALANEFLKGKLADASSFLAIAQGQDASVTLDTLGAFADALHQHLEQVLPLRLRRGLPQPDRLDDHLLGLPQALQDGRPDRAPESQVRGPQVPGRRADPRADASERLICPRPGLLRRHLLLDGLPPERRDPDLSSPGTTPCRASARPPTCWFDMTGLLPVFLSLLGLVFLCEEVLGQTGPRPGRGLVRRLRRPGLSPLQRICRGQSVPAPDVPALQSVLHRRPDASRRRPLRLAQPQGQGAFGAAQDRLRHADRRPSAYAILVVGSLGLLSPKALGGQVAPAASQVSVYWLISTYFMLTIAELFLSPIGISFVSKVAPPKYKGLMQGGWFAATAVGNSLVGVTAFFWERLPLWTVWAILAGGLRPVRRLHLLHHEAAGKGGQRLGPGLPRSKAGVRRA